MFVTPRWMLLALLRVATGTAQIGSINDPTNCGPDVVCQGKDPTHYPEQFKPTEGKLSRCYCDEDCVKYRDCCADLAPFPYDTKSTIVWSCVPKSLYQSVYAVSNCLEKNSEYKKLCEKDFYPPVINYLLDIPGYSNRTGMYYANVFCAHCDPQFGPEMSSEFNFMTPNFVIKCSENITLNMEAGQYLNGTLTWKVGNGSCAIFQEEVVTFGRSCVESISSCPGGSDADLSAKCGAYSLLLSDSNKVYRNPHCALCNGVKRPDLFCKYRPGARVLPRLTVILGLDWDMDRCDTPGRMHFLENSSGNCTAVTCLPGKGCEIHSCNHKSCHYKNQISHIIDGYLTYICLSVSAACLLVHVYKSIFVCPPKNLPAKVLNSLAWSLLIAQTFFLFGMYSLIRMSPDLCFLVAIVIQYFFLASFFWMNVISIDIWYTFSDSFKLTSTSYMKYALYAWGGAALFTASSIMADKTSMVSNQYRPHYGSGQSTCWFGSWMGLAVFFCFPVLSILVLNTIFFVLTICLFRKQYKSTESLPISGRKDYSVLFLYIKLSTIMGMTWVLGLILTTFVKETDYNYPFTVLNGLQGAFIFIVFDWKTDVIFNYVKGLLLRLFGGNRQEKK